MKTIRLFGLSLLFVIVLTSILRTQDGNAQSAAPVTPSTSAQASPSAAKIALAEELLGLLHVEETVNVSLDQALGIQKDMGAKMGMPPEAQARQMKFMQAIMGDMKKVFNWSAVKDDYVRIYADAFTEDELRGLVAFFKSPLGQTYVTKQPEIQAAMMQKMQGMMAQLIPQIQAAAQKMVMDRIVPSSSPAPQTSPAATP